MFFFFFFFFFFNDTATTEIYTLSLHDALPISAKFWPRSINDREPWGLRTWGLVLENRSEEHTSELQSRFDLVCRLLLEKKKKKKNKIYEYTKKKIFIKYNTHTNMTVLNDNHTY